MDSEAEKARDEWINAHVPHVLQCEYTEEIHAIYAAGGQAATERAASIAYSCAHERRRQLMQPSGLTEEQSIAIMVMRAKASEADRIAAAIREGK